MIRRGILIALLTTGMIGGYASAFAHMRHSRERWLAYHDAVARCSELAEPELRERLHPPRSAERGERGERGDQTRDALVAPVAPAPAQLDP